MNMDMSPAVIFFSRPIIYMKRQAGTYVGPRFVPGGLVSSTVQATVQPATSKDLMILPEADRRQQVMAIWTLFKLYVSGDNINTSSDMVQIDGDNYKVIHTFNRLQNNFFKALIEFIPPDLS